jgi:hypothetical protein
VTTKEQRDVAIARQNIRKAFYDSFNTLNVTDIVDGIMEGMYAVVAERLPKRKTPKRKPRKRR